MKQYIGISRDHSGSMAGIQRAAAHDYNQTIDSIKQAVQTQSIDTVVSVVKCGVGIAGNVVVETVNSSVSALKPLSSSEYEVDGTRTPLFDSIGELIEILQKTPDANDQEVSFLIIATTDGQNNVHNKWTASSLKTKMMQLQATDRWTFVFRVPGGYKRSLVSLGIPEGNIQEWEQTETGMQASTVQTRAAFTQYYSARASGAKSTRTFYANAANIDPAELQKNLKDISQEVELWIVKDATEGKTIREFVDKKLGSKGMFHQGAAFYQLTKPEREVQDYKLIVIRDKKSGVIYGGAAARQMLGIPDYGTVRVAPGDHGSYDVFVQSTSVNRKLPVNSIVLHWPTFRS